MIGPAPFYGGAILHIHHRSNTYYSLFASAVEAAHAPSPACLAHVIKALYFHLPSLWICNSERPCAADWVTPPILPECNSNRMGSLPLLTTINLNAATASVLVNTLHPPDVPLIVNGAPLIAGGVR